MLKGNTQCAKSCSVTLRNVDRAAYHREGTLECAFKLRTKSRRFDTTDQLPALGINSQFVSFTNVTMESDKYICVRETGAANSVVIVECANPSAVLRRPITADSALMNPVAKVIALKAAVAGSSSDHLQIFNLELKSKMKSFAMAEPVVFWKWLSPSLLGLVTATAVFHWSIEVRNSARSPVSCLLTKRSQGSSEPVKAFDRTPNLAGSQIINYRASPDEKWLVLVGIAPGAPEASEI